MHVQKENFHGYTFISQVTKPIFKSIPEHSEHQFLSDNFPSYVFKTSSVFRYFSVTLTNLFLLSIRNINPENFLRNAKQEFPCHSLESFSEEYYSMENKILDFQFGPVCANQTRPNYSVRSRNPVWPMECPRMAQLWKMWKDINQLRIHMLSPNSGS